MEFKHYIGLSLFKQRGLLHLAKIAWVSSLALILGIGAQWVYYQGKAQLAQILLNEAWQKTIQSSKQQSHADKVLFRPWPWADTWPTLKVSLHYSQEPIEKPESYIVLANTSGESLAFAPGLLTQNILPGDRGNSIIAAHKNTHFSSINQLKLGDLISVVRADQREYFFRINEIRIVDSEESFPVIQHWESRLTLVTCYPFSENAEYTSLRYLVHASLVL
ncbi:sortase [Aliikangiella sp. IMCC44653]